MKKVLLIFSVIFYISYVNLFSQSYSKVTWHKLSYYDPDFIKQIETSPDYPNNIYVATGNFDKVIDNEERVEVLYLIYGGWMSCFAIDPNNGNNIYIAEAGGQLLFSGDAGKNWTTKNSYGDIQSIAVYKNNINIIYLAVLDPGYSVLKSTDGGDTFTKINYSFPAFYYPECLLVSSGNPDIAFSGTASDGIFKINGGDVTHVVNYLNIDSIKEDPSDPNIIYAGTNDGIYKSLNCGNTWTRISFFNKSIRTLKIDPKNTNILYTYVSSYPDYGIYRCTDGGYNWTYLGGKISNDQISSIAINPLNSNQIFIGGAVWIGLWKTNILDTNNSLAITFPDSSTTWITGQTYTIRWNYTGAIERVNLLVLKGDNVVDTKTNLTNDGEYEYKPYLSAGNDYRIKIKDYTNKEIADYSDYFSITDNGGSPQITVTSPNGGEIWEVGSTHNITWNSTGSIDDVAIEFSTNNGNSWTTIQYNTNNDGVYAWTVHNTPSNQCRVRISDTTGVPSDISDSTFSIVQDGPVITLNDALDNSILNFSSGGYDSWFGQSSIYYYGGSSAQSGDIFNYEHTYLQTTISGPGNLTFYWKVSSEFGCDYLSLYIDGELKNRISGDIDWSQESYHLSSGSHLVEWIYEKDESVHLGSDCGWVDKVSFTGSVTPTITVISPNGGESWEVGSTNNITWTSTESVGKVKLEVTTDNGTNWTVFDASATNDGMRPWLVPNTPSSNCKIRISETDGSPSDTSDSVFSIVSSSTPPQISLKRTQIYFGATTSGASTSSQSLFVDNSGGGTLIWSVTDNAPWLDCSPSSGTNSGPFTISVDVTGLSAGTYTGTITVSDPTATNSPQTVSITLNVYGTGQNSVPFGLFETPTHNSTVRSSISVSGWALDDIGVESVKIYRQEGATLVYIGDAIFVEGARPDVEQAYPGYPKNYQAGWGYMLLTNFLPNSGNGTFVLYAKATDMEGQEITLGTKTITCDNANAVKPFGAIDTPRQGGSASGSSFRNHGWVLTPLPNSIPTDGSTINVYVDGMDLGHPNYNNYRSDIAALFPGYENKDGAGGYFDIDTTAYTNGVHTIYWTAQDNAGNIDGIGSRFFTIQNTGDSRTKSASTQVVKFDLPQISELPIDFSNPIRVKQGYGKNIESRIITPNDKGMARITIKELERIEIQLADMESEVTGYVLAGEKFRPLPIGSSIKNGGFYWTLIPGFLGDYRLVFVVKDHKGDLSRREILIRIKPKFGLNKD